MSYAHGETDALSLLGLRKHAGMEGLDGYFERLRPHELGNTVPGPRQITAKLPMLQRPPTGNPAFDRMVGHFKETHPDFADSLYNYYDRIRPIRTR